MSKHVSDKAGEYRPLSVNDLVKVTTDCVVGNNVDTDTLLNQVALELGKCWEHEECSAPSLSGWLLLAMPSQNC